MFRIAQSVTRSVLPRVQSIRALSTTSRLQAETVFYTKDHEWIQLNDAGSDVARVGITGYAVQALGDITYLSLSDIEDAIDDGDEIAAGETLCEVESVKSASEIKIPVAGVPVSINEDLSEDDAKALMSEPEGSGYICEVKVSSADDVSSLMNAEAYSAFLEEQKE